MPPLLSLLLALWAIVGSHVAISEMTHPVEFTDLYGVRREGPAATACPHGAPVVWLSPSATLAELDHELAHAVDCLDDGTMNGSPGPARPASRPAWASDFCWDSPVEWYACLVVHDLRVHPQAPAASAGGSRAPVARFGGWVAALRSVLSLVFPLPLPLLLPQRTQRRRPRRDGTGGPR